MPTRFITFASPKLALAAALFSAAAVQAQSPRGTSEATSIYDPKNSLFTAYGVLFEQWRIQPIHHFKDADPLGFPFELYPV